MEKVVRLRQRLQGKPEAPAVEKPRNWMKRLPMIMRRMRAQLAHKDARTEEQGQGKVFTHPLHPPGVGPVVTSEDQEVHTIAMDQEIVEAWNWANGASSTYGTAFSEGVTFLGYAYLSALAQRAEYRVVAETIAAEMTREWIVLKSASDDKGKAEKIKELDDAQKEFQLQHRFYKIALDDGQFGRSHLYVELDGATDDRDELITPIGDGRDLMSKAKFKLVAEEEGDVPEEDKKDGEKKGVLKAFRNVEAVWCYPTRYDSNDPLKAGWYRPRTWYVMGKELHVTRFLTFVGREVPDMLKPAYSFGGLSIYQMLKPYVDNWLQTRQSVSNLIQRYSTNVFATDMGAATLAAEGEGVFERIDFFNFVKNNFGTLLVDKNTEEYTNVSVSLGTLDTLQAQAQEHMAAIARIPLVKLLGISPHGLNASSEGEIRAFYDWIAAFQEHLFRKHLQTCLDFIMLDLWGEVDEDITFDFKSLWQLDAAGQAGVEKTKADIDDVYLASGVVSAQEIRERVAHDKDSQYASLELNPDKLPQQPGEMGGEGEPPEPGQPPGGNGPGGQMQLPKPSKRDLGAETTSAAEHAGQTANSSEQSWDELLVGLAQDGALTVDGLLQLKRFRKSFDEFIESQHPRDNEGKFSEVAGGHSPRKADTAMNLLPSHIGHMDEAVNKRIAALEEAGEDDPDNHEYAALSHIGTVLDEVRHAKLSQKQYQRSAFVRNPETGEALAAGLLKINPDNRKQAEITNVGSITGGGGTAVIKSLIEQAKQKGIQRIDLDSTASDFYAKLGFKPVGGNKNHMRFTSFDEFVESEHPRGGNPENPGEFSKGSGSKGVGSSAGSHLVAAHEDRSQWPKHVQVLKLPPAWTDVKYSNDPKANLQAIGKDAKGRPQYVYSAKFRDSQSAEKFARIKKLATKFDAIVKKNEANMLSKDSKKAEHAAVLGLILDMGLRPGSEKDTGAEKQAYGATTLRGEHVVTEEGKTFLRFTGKKGVDLNLPVEDKALANALQKRASHDQGQLFPEVNDASLRNYVHTLGAGIKVKDFRTLKGTSTAAQLVSSLPAPKNEKEYKARVKQVAEVVSKKLGNTPTIALQSYISPFVFAEWKQGLDG